ncbi:SIR2 family NAD-dependent protein deacylase [Methylobacterium pseudosasicola]|uniref:SIR2-like domain-containing protein n=1 Tax=Methylobacterium pseudosasicola TaxID=582667 RepID=A0A1I4PT76_9HYPH|nr:SIR2 family protein [Methylobacterium pseudosasicola]SFM30673.1 SIR2-like domain-containing protein [Methylobacterium pseudosasicola]
MLDGLARAIHTKRAVLFVGAGVSMSLGLPSWGQLMNKIAEELDYDPNIMMGPGVNYLTIAEFYKLEKGKIGGLRSWMDREWSVDDAKLQASKVHNQIVELDFPFIYTTNYDRNIENIFKLKGMKHHKIANAKDITLANPDIAHIVKFHGDFDDDLSMVLTESDYFERLNFETPLDIKFRSDILGRSVLFVGYSLTDLNMRLLLYKMQKMWKLSGYEGDRPPSYMFMTRPDPVQQRVLRSWGVETITMDVDNVEDALPNFFETLIASVAALK